MNTFYVGRVLHVISVIFCNYLKKQKKKQKKNKNKKINLKIEVRSLTCLFVYKVLNQEVLDDRGKFEVSLWKNESFEKLKTRFLKMFVLLAFQDMKVFRACDKEYDPNRIHFRLRSLKPRRSASTIKQASRVRIVGPRPGQISGWGWNWLNVSENVQEASKSFLNREERKVLQGLYWSYSFSVDLIYNTIFAIRFSWNK